MPAITDLVGGVVDEALGLGAPGIALAAVAGVAVFGASRTRPLAKGAIKGYLSLRDQARTLKDQAGELAAGTRDGLKDLYAEARHEHAAESDLGGPAAATIVAGTPAALEHPVVSSGPAESPELVKAHTITEAVEKASEPEVPATTPAGRSTAESPARNRRAAAPRSTNEATDSAGT